MKPKKYTCEGCPGLCCSDLEESITKPRTIDDWDNLKWELHFSNTKAFIRNRRWYKLTLGTCIYLDENKRCTIYERRPQVCRDHNPPGCEFYGSIYDTIFETPEQLDAYIKKEKRKRKNKKRKSVSS